MTDRELLELAAKAAGMALVWNVVWNGMAKWQNVVDGFDFDSYWNPLTDDGDALRLAVKLEMLIDIEGHTARAVVKHGDHEVYQTDGDPTAATRRAIVRAAAEIGQALMKQEEL